MADPNIKISITADDKATGKLKNLDDQVGKTGDGMGKLGKAAAAGGVALVALGVKSVLAFEDLGLTVGKFADATGATAEEASRLIEIGDDLGISSDTLSSSIGKMSKQLGANKDAFAAYGVEVQKNADGTTNVNETFLQAVDAINQIQDPLKKAEASAKIFGKGYQQMSELLGESSKKIRTDLAAVSDQKVFDEKKVQDARDMRAAFDSIVDSGQDLLLTIGKALAPVITKLAPILVKVVEAAAPLADALGDVLVTALETVGPIIEGLLPLIQALAKGLGLVAKAISVISPTEAGVAFKAYINVVDELRQKADAAGLSQEEFNKIIDASTAAAAEGTNATDHWAAIAETASKRLDELTNSTSETDRETRKLGQGATEAAVSEEELATAADAAKEALAKYKEMSGQWADSVKADVDQVQAEWDQLTGDINNDKTWLDLQTSFDELKPKIVDAWKAAADGAVDAEQKTRDAHVAIDDQKLAVIQYGKEVLGLPPEKLTKVLALIDQGAFDAAEEALRILTRDRGAGIFTDVNIHSPKYGGAQAAGGPVQAGMAYTVGEKGQETFVPDTNGTIIPNGAMGGGGVTIDQVHIHVATMPSENELMRLLATYRRRNGPGALRSLTS